MTGARTSERAFFGFASLTGTSQPDSWNLTTSLSSAWALRGGTSASGLRLYRLAARLCHSTHCHNAQVARGGERERESRRWPA